MLFDFYRVGRGKRNLIILLVFPLKRVDTLGQRLNSFLTEMLPREKKAWMGQVVLKPVCQGTLYVPELPQQEH